MPPKKRRQQNNKENEDQNPPPAAYDPLSIEPILNENLQQFETNFTDEYRSCEKRIEAKLKDVHREFEKFIQTHEAQNKLARLLDQEITRIHQEQGTKASSPCQELMEKTTDLMNASAAETSRTKTYLIGELQQLPMKIGNEQK